MTIDNLIDAISEYGTKEKVTFQKGTETFEIESIVEKTTFSPIKEKRVIVNFRHLNESKQ